MVDDTRLIVAANHFTEGLRLVDEVKSEGVELKEHGHLMKACKCARSAISHVKEVFTGGTAA